MMYGWAMVVSSMMCGATKPAPAAERVPIHAWIGVPQEHTTVERYRELADCGFTTSFSNFKDTDAVQKALDVAHEAGVRLFIHCPELKTDPEGTAKRFMAHPALGGYHLVDEPNAADFPALAAWLRRVEAVDRAHPCYINLFPTYASQQQLGTATYQEHVDRFVKEVPVPFISFDHYPVVGDRLRDDWYRNLEIIRTASLAANKPFWAFALSVGHGTYPVPTVAHLRVQVFSDLAYGAQCIQYFTYWTPRSATWDFHDAPITADGKRTVVYERVKQVNAEIQGLARVFVGSRVVSVGHIGKVPAGAKAYQPAAPVKSLRTTGPGAVVSLLEKGNRRFLVVVNRDIKAPATLTAEFDPAAKVRRVAKDGSETALDPQAGITIEPGDVCVFAWDQ